MKIDGRLIASKIKEDLKLQITILKSRHITPHLSVILVGSDRSSSTYVAQKQKVGQELGAKVSLLRSSHIGKKDLLKITDRLNKDKTVHGVIIQRPLPVDVGNVALDSLVAPKKDIDGFHPQSPYSPPISLAVLEILNWVFITSNQGHELDASFAKPEMKNPQFLNWLKAKSILIIGRGETGGKPIAETLTKIGIPFQVAHSKTKDLKSLCLTSDIIISAVGKSNIVRHDMVNSNTILIGVGLHEEGDKLSADYNQEEISAKVASYTPVPGGVGPVNVACLFVNLLLAAIEQTS